MVHVAQTCTKEKTLKDVSTAYAAAPVPIQRAVRTGSVSTHREIEMTNELIQRNGNYSVTRLAKTKEISGVGWLLHYLFLVGGIVAGFLLVLRGQRLRIEPK
ncbi:hypothetical protein SAMN05421858_2598 [Haladaptatus litoreus]|uniref:Uncharacterized protein n=1 Tax=Haladaptatus litoreus TaxID=553468 RepID=A0A1N7BK46_9EURY|nr:hypothetical protein [Haladaptatus litoreus]SIR51616.1 hypothetical protein SAMN05421858_2598 [Haladaptatus litoreus]